MADETPDTENETPDATVEDVEATAPNQGEDAAVEAAPEPTKAQARAAKKQAAASTRPSRSPQERQEERDAERKRKAAARRRRRVKEREKRKAAPKAEHVAPLERPQGRQKVRQGVVTSAKPDKTITVRIDDARRHRRYEKIVRSSKTLHAHDEANDAGEGDTVRVVECRPMSRSKRWKLEAVLERAK